jgi:uncharacterized protein (TIGR00266 family)
MDIEILHGPGNSAARVRLAGNESLVAEGGAMIAMSGDVRIETTTHQKSGGGIGAGLKRMLAGESFFLNHFTASPRGGEVWLATTLAGDMMEHPLSDSSLVVQSGSFVGCEKSVDIGMGWQGFKSFFSGESVFWLNLKGRGKVILSSFGAIYPVVVKGAHIVDTGHIVAFEESLRFNISKAGKSWLSSILGGEGLVCRFEGQGTVWCQSHNAPTFGRLLGPKLRPR